MIGSTRGVGTEAVWWESVGERGGPERTSSGTSSATGVVSREGKLSPIVGYVLIYGRFYREGSGSQTGGGTPDPFQDV